MMSTPEKQARHYRDLAIQLRARAYAVTDEDAREGMLEAAMVWDQLAELCGHVNLVVATTLPQFRPLS